MLEAIRGKYLGRSEGHVILEVGDLVFRIISDAESFTEHGQGDEVTVYTKLVVSQDDVSIYGFDTKEKRNVFEKLIRVSKLGPKTAVKILSSATVEFLTTTIANGDVDRLSTVPGIGRKTAERIVTELKDEFEATEFDESELEAIEALVSLGYSRTLARSAVKQAKAVVKEGNVAKLIKQALKVISKL